MLKHFKVVTPAIPAAELDKFRSYVKSFYSTDGMAVYPIADSATLDAAIDAYIANIGEHCKWGGGDSIDRERVRQIIQPDFMTVQDRFFS